MPVSTRRSDLPPVDSVKALWRRYELPNWVVAIAIYGAWAILFGNARHLPWYVLSPVGAYILAWHFSLQHEAIHGWLSAPKWLRTALVWPPIGGWLPFEIYRKSHSQHHRDVNITVPAADTETVYHRKEDWDRYSKAWRAVLMFNQTLLGRLLIGPILRLRKLVIVEAGLLRAGDFRNVGVWLRFFVSIAAILWFVSSVGGMPVWQYYLLIVYPSMSIGLLRAFIEHRWGDTPDERIAAVETNRLFGMLFLWNNLHIVHHVHPSMAWYDIPGYYRANRAKLLAMNGSYMFPGYLHIARRWFWRPVFVPVHPGTSDQGVVS